MSNKGTKWVPDCCSFINGQVVELFLAGRSVPYTSSVIREIVQTLRIDDKVASFCPHARALLPRAF